MNKYHKDIEINQNVVDEIFKADLYHHEFNNDIIHIQYALKSKFNISLTVPETILFWEWKSTAYCASWLMLSSDNDIVESFQKFVNYSYYSKKEKTMVKKLPVTKKKTMKKKKEKEWVKVIENEDGSTSAVFDLDSEKEDMIKRLYNVEVITTEETTDIPDELLKINLNIDWVKFKLLTINSLDVFSKREKLQLSLSLTFFAAPPDKGIRRGSNSIYSVNG